MADTDVKAWLNGAQQLFDGPQDISEETPTTTGGLSDGSMAFFVGKPKTDGSGEWILKKVTPGNLNKMVFNYLTQSDIASQLASVLGAFANIKSDLRNVDLDNITYTCCFNVNATDASTVSNLPVKNNAMRCFVIRIGIGGDSTCIQIGWMYNGDLYYRTFWSGSSFKPWKKIQAV